jgi:hypothetical protein
MQRRLTPWANRQWGISFSPFSMAPNSSRNSIQASMRGWVTARPGMAPVCRDWAAIRGAVGFGQDAAPVRG